MSRTILVADDSVTIHKVVGLAFAGEDVRIETAVDGLQAVEKARAMQPDLILADALLPGRSGYELCDAVKRDAALCHTPVVLLVSTFEPFDQAKAARVNCDGHLVKPFDTKELVQVAVSLWSLQNKSSREGKVKMPLEDKPAVGTEPLESLNLVSARTRKSFLGNNRILDVFGAKASMPPTMRSTSAARGKRGILAGKPSKTAAEMETAPAEPIKPLLPEKMPDEQSTQAVRTAIEIPENAVDEIVEKVIRRISAEVIREIAWEVVPELSEIIIRDYIREKGLPTKE